MAADPRETALPDTDADSDDDVVERPPMESTRRGRLLISAFVLVLLVALFGANMPDSVLKAGLLTVAQPVLNVTGLDQSWGVFAPNPPRETNTVFARIDHADGTSAVREVPVTSGISEYWNYRWSKYGEQLRQEDRQDERVAFARWVAGQDRDAGGIPVRVTLIRHATPLSMPGAAPDEGAPRDVPFFTMAVAR